MLHDDGVGYLTRKDNKRDKVVEVVHFIGPTSVGEWEKTWSSSSGLGKVSTAKYKVEQTVMHKEFLETFQNEVGN